MKIQVEVKLMNVNTKTFAPPILVDFNVKPVTGKRIGQQIRELKEKALKNALDKSGLAKYPDIWSFRSYLKSNPYLCKDESSH